MHTQPDINKLLTKYISEFVNLVAEKQRHISKKLLINQVQCMKNHKNRTIYTENLRFP